MKLYDLFPEEELVQAIDEGFISARPHPIEALHIYNYTKECQYRRAWNSCTKQCRGLIATPDGDVVARPFPKFFNYGEPDVPPLDLQAPARVMDKLDGSLGILYPTSGFGISDGYRDGTWAIATRGSFESEQAQVATEILADYLDGTWIPLRGLTYLFEIIYPENRIVVDYGDTRDLVLLAVINNRTGEDLGAGTCSWPGPIAETFDYRTLAEALAAPARDNAEGFVVETGGLRVKIKQEDYVELHRLVTGLNQRVVWEQLGNGLSVDEIKAPVPEEFHDWIEDVAIDLRFRADHIWYEANDAYESILSRIPAGSDRKTFALEAQKENERIRPYLFMFLDGKDARPAIWKTVRPAGNLAPRDFAEAS